MSGAGLGYLLVALAVAVPLYAYAAYPLLVWTLARVRRVVLSGRNGARREPGVTSWPHVSILVPAHNAEATLAETLERILALDYPAQYRQIIVASDASTDGTDSIARSYAHRCVELVRLAERRGKTATENYARARFRGEIVVTVDASILLPPGSLKALVKPFLDPEVGVASGRDVSVARQGESGTSGESGYVGYEMWVRDQETAVYGIVGASGCFYAERAELYERYVPEHLSRDFISALVAREHDFRAVSVKDAICYVPRTPSFTGEYRRKVRTITRGIATLWHKRSLLNPFRYGVFAWMLGSHKVARWLVPWTALMGLLGLAVISPLSRWAAAGSLLLVVGLGLAGRQLARSGEAAARQGAASRWLVVAAYALASNVAVLHAWWNVFTGNIAPAWNPTARSACGAASGKVSGVRVWN